MQRVSLDLSKSQLSKLRNGHNIRILPHMVGSGVDMIIDPKTYHNMAKKLDRGRGVVMGLTKSEIEANAMEGSGLMMGAGNKSGKISRIKKGNRWRDFSNQTLRDGIDTAKYGYEQYQEAKNPIGTKFKKLFGGEMGGGKINLSGLKKAYNKNVKNTALGSALRESSGLLINDAYDASAKQLDRSKYTRPISKFMKEEKQGNVRKLNRLSGVGLKLQHGNGLKLSGGSCEFCGGSMNDKFIFASQSL